MDNYIFMTNYYLPKPGATGMCVHQVAKELAKNNNVFTVCYEDGDQSKKVDGVKIIKIKIPSYLKNVESQNSRLKKIKQVQSLIRKAIHIYDYPLRSQCLVDKYYRTVSRIIDEYDSATIVSSYTPLEAVVAAYKIKKKYKDKINIVYYSTDTLSNEQGSDGILPVSYRRRCGIRWEKKLFSLYDKILIMECHKEHYFSKTYDSFREKMVLVNFPLFNRMEEGDVQKECFDGISFVYTGTFYRVLRNPQFICDILVALCKKEKIVVDILGTGDCNDIIEKAVDESGGSIIFHGMQSHETVIKYLNSADILLSIGNAESPMAPSKIYEYMSTGKPIIHTYTYDKDPCIEPLQKYGNALLIKEHDPDSILKIEAFIENRKVLRYQDVERKFETSIPKYTAEILKNGTNGADN